MKIYTKESLVEALMSIRDRGWIENTRKGNDGAVGNILEDFLGIEENNLPIPNAAEWELKAQRAKTSSLTTIFHMEPSPRACKFVPQMFLNNYGWSHQEAGTKYPANEMSFRQTIKSGSTTNRGFGLKIDYEVRKVRVFFDSSKVDTKCHGYWLQSVNDKIGLGELDPQPYWGFDDLGHKAGTKLINCFYVKADVKNKAGIQYFHYNQITMLKTFSTEKFINALASDMVYVDFDARTGHNHGTKFRLKQNAISELYEESTVIT